MTHVYTCAPERSLGNSQTSPTQQQTQKGQATVDVGRTERHQAPQGGERSDAAQSAKEVIDLPPVNLQDIALDHPTGP